MSLQYILWPFIGHVVFMIFDNFGTRNPMLGSFAMSGNCKIFKMADTKWPICLPNTVIFRCDHLC